MLNMLRCINGCLVFLSFLLFVSASFASDKVSLHLAWKHQFQFAGYYAALHQGYYKDAGLDVTIIEGGEGRFAREALLDGRAQYGIAGSELLVHRKDGDPFVVLAPIFQHSPSTLLVKKNSGITNLQDLIGKRVMLLPGKKDADILAAFLNEGISLDLIHRLDQSYNLKDLIHGRTDAVSAYTTNEPWHLLQKDIQPVVISPQTYGVDFYSDCLFTTETEVKDHPERAARFLKASLQGWEYAMAHPDDIIHILLNEYRVNKSPGHLKYEAESIRKIMQPQLVQIGHMNPGRWRHIARIYEKLGFIDPGFSLDGFLYTPNAEYDFFRLKKTVTIAMAVIVLLCLGFLILFFFNRRLKSEVVQRKNAEEKLCKSEALFRGLYDNMTSGSAIYQVINDGSKGSDYIVKQFNKKSLEIEGVTLDQVVGKSLFDLRPNIDDYGLIPMMKKVWDTGEPAYFPMKMYEDDIFSSYYENYIFKIPTGEVVTIYNDVTDQKNSEIALKESEKRFALAMEFANDGLFDWNLVTHDIYYSPGWKRILGYEDDELPNDFSVWEALTDPEGVKRSWKMQRELINKKRNRFDVEFRMKHKKGHWVDILSRANAIFDENNEAVRIIGTHSDISERKRLENQLLQSQKLESIGNLAGGIAHDFNNILSSILGFTELAMDDAVKGSAHEDSLQEVYSAGQRAKDLVKQILAFARQSDEKTGPIQPSTIAKEVLGFIRSTIPTTIEIHQDIESDALIMGNATQVHQVFMNLCTNAAHAMEDSGGVLRVALKDVVADIKEPSIGTGQRAYLEIKVSDTGEGIAPDILNSVFDPYFTTKGPGEGTGMGLAMVQGVVESYGGTIAVDSEPAKGTTFTIHLPITRKQSPKDSYLPQALPKGSERVLFIDDEAPIAKMGNQIFDRLGYQVTTRTSSIEALTLFQTKPDAFDLVVTDMTMPNLTGVELAVELMKIRPDIPVILCTGYSKQISDETITQIGIRAIVYKPIVKAEMAKIVRKVLDEAIDFYGGRYWD